MYKRQLVDIVAAIAHVDGTLEDIGLEDGGVLTLPGQGGNTKMTVEKFYQGAVDAEILIYDNTSDVSVSTVADILANGDYLADMKAIQEGNVWGIQKNYWQSADDVATMIEDIATIIYHPEDADQLHYFYKLPAE